MRATASVLHLDLDAFFAAVEQRDKPSLRGKPVIVGGIGQRGVVSTASYEARVFGVHSAMPMHEARRRCPHAAFLSGRFGAYRKASGIVMGLLRELSPLVEPLSLDEAFVDLAVGERSLEPDAVLIEVAELRSRLAEETGGLTASVGIGSSKFIAKVATELAKPDGVRLVTPGTEVETIAPLPARAIPGIGPVTMEKLSRLGVSTVADLQGLSSRELVRELGRSQGEWIAALAFARDDRPVEPDREAKSISVEDTFETDVTDRAALDAVIERDAAGVAKRLATAGLFARTITIKARYPDFTTLTRSRTLDGATDAAETVAAVARVLLDTVDVPRGLRLFGVGVAGLTESAQEALFEPFETPAVEPVDGPLVEPVETSAEDGPGFDKLNQREETSAGDGPGFDKLNQREETSAGDEPGFDKLNQREETSAGDEPGFDKLNQREETSAEDGPGFDKLNQRERVRTVEESGLTHTGVPTMARRPPGYRPGDDVVHDEHGAGWVWGAGLGRVTVRFETAETGPGKVRTFSLEDPALHPAPT